MVILSVCFFFFQAEDGIRDLVRSRGLGDVYKRQACGSECNIRSLWSRLSFEHLNVLNEFQNAMLIAPTDFGSAHRYPYTCLLYTSDAADDLLCVDLGGRRIIKKKNITTNKKLHKKKNISTQTYKTQI